MCYFSYKQNQLTVPELNSNSNDTNLPVIVAQSSIGKRSPVHKNICE